MVLLLPFLLDVLILEDRDGLLSLSFLLLTQRLSHQMQWGINYDVDRASWNCAMIIGA